MKKLLLSLTFAMAAVAGWSQCTASFNDTLATWTPNPHDVWFENTSTGFQNGTVFQWTFQNGTPSTYFSSSLDTFSVTFAGPGTYVVSMALQDTGGNCMDSIFSIITIPDYLTVSGQNTTCGSCNGQATATMSGGMPPYSYIWSSGSTAATASNLCAGTHYVTVTDANAYQFIDSLEIIGTGGSISVNIGVSNPTPCPGESVELFASANGGAGPYSFSWNTGAIDSIYFINQGGMYIVTTTDANGCTAIDSVMISYQSSPTATLNGTHETCLSCCDGSVTASSSGNTSYNWSNGDTNATITGLCPGLYTVTITDQNTGCADSFAFSVNAFTCYGISGFIAQGEHVKVYLIQESGGILTAVDSVITDTMGGYYFTNVCNGVYYIKASLMPMHTSYGSFVPTYYDSTAMWSFATALVLNGSNLNYVDFGLLAGSFAGGPGFVGGLISQGANRDEGDPVANVNLILTNESGDVIDFATSNAQGEYSFDNLPLGVYELYVDILNKTSYPLTFTLDEENLTVENGNFFVYNEYIKPELPSGINSVTGKLARIYPNPAEDLLRIESDTPIHQLRVYSILGEQVLSMPVSGTDVNLFVGSLPAGQYILALHGMKTIDHLTFVKQ